MRCIQDLTQEEHTDLAFTTEIWLYETGGVNFPSRILGSATAKAKWVERWAPWSVRIILLANGPLASFQYLYLMLGDQDRLGILLVHRPPYCLPNCLVKLTEID